MSENVVIHVRDGNVEGALHALKKLMMKAGIFREMRHHEMNMKPSARRKVKSTNARKKVRRAERKTAEWNARTENDKKFIYHHPGDRHEQR